MIKRNVHNIAIAALVLLALYFTHQIDQLKTENTKLKETQVTQTGNWDFTADYSLTSK